MEVTSLRIVVFIAAVCLAAASCSRTRGKPQEFTGSTVDVPEFAIAFKLSPQAEIRLKRIHESIEVLAMFDGDPLPGQGKYNPPNRDVMLGSSEKPVDANNCDIQKRQNTFERLESAR